MSLPSTSLRKHLRFSFSFACAILCLSIFAMWTRSYHWWDSVQWAFKPKQGVIIGSQSGGAFLEYFDVSGTQLMPPRWRVVVNPSPNTDFFPIGGMDGGFAGFLSHIGPSGFLIGVPYWGLILTTIALASIPWVPWKRRFSLRAMLIAMTIVAAALGVIVLFAQ